MAIENCLLALLFALAMSQQLLYASAPHTPLDFPFPAVNVPVSGRDSALDSTEDTFDYVLMAWLIQFQVLSPVQVFFGLYTNEARNLAVTRSSSGRYSVSAFDGFGRSYEVAVDGELGKWEHLAVAVCAGRTPYRLSVCRTSWKADRTDCLTRIIDTTPVAYSPDFTRINLGSGADGLMYGMFTDIVIYTQGCIGENWIYSQIAPFPCASECLATCLGPSFYDCLGYSQLFRPDSSKSAQVSVFSFGLSNPSFLHRSILSPNIGFSGWFQSMNPTLSQENLFKLENSRCYLPSSPGDGCQVLGVYHDSTNFIVFVEDTMGLVASATITDVRTK